MGNRLSYVLIQQASDRYAFIVKVPASDSYTDRYVYRSHNMFSALGIF